MVDVRGKGRITCIKTGEEAGSLGCQALYCSLPIVYCLLSLVEAYRSEVNGSIEGRGVAGG
jgi:hypothetical protein